MNTSAQKQPPANVDSPQITARRRLPYALLVLAVVLVVVSIDQVTKRTILAAFSPGEIKPVIDGMFNLTLSFNTGAAFGLWTGLANGWREIVLGLTILMAMALVVFLLTRPYYQTLLAQTALALILGGAIGNVIDRCIYGAVVDFLDFHIGTSHWPAFNVADSAICIGVGLLLFLPKQDSRPLS
jgi:signal peptidase II